MASTSAWDMPNLSRRKFSAVTSGPDTSHISVSAARFAIVAPTDLAFGLGRMYGAHRSMEDRSTKQVGVFRTLDEALTFLDVSGT